jgi:class 3 adenylate cyclase/tetratricopeptide (TPR) repeat protein
VDGARFCASCGQPLQRRSDERRVVTILFADLVGFTSMAEARDPEHVKNLVDRCFEWLVLDIAAYGGRVDKIVGDAILALFGAPVAHEDDAERAVRAGLAMQRTLADWASTPDERALRLRIGINTGEVLVGALRAGGDYTAMGDVVNTASRLQTAASPGQVLVGPATVAATRGVVRYTSLGPVVVRGREEPVEACVAEEALLPPGARPNRGRAPLVGREPELGLLAHAIDSAAARHRAHLLLLVGEAGMGKTRLAEEAAAAAECNHDALVLEGRCVPYGEANVWWPVAEALRAGCGIAATDPMDVAKERCTRAVTTALGDSLRGDVERVTNGLLHLMGYDGPLRDIDPTRAREEMVRSLFTFVESSTRRRPMVIVLSDLHWADDIVLERMGDLLERVATQPFVLIATARHALLERWSPKPGRHNTVVFNLDPLDREAATALLGALVEGDLPADLRDVLLNRSGGNPFYLEELVALLTEAGMVGGASSRPAELPDTLRGLVAARLDGLSGDERRTLDDAAVMGRRGTISALEIMAREAHEIEDISGAIAGLVSKDVLVVEDGKWSFRSDLVREVAYGMLTKADRVRRHFGIAKWMEMHHVEGAADIDRTARHYAIAASLVNEIGAVDHVAGVDLMERAVYWLHRALEQAENGELHMVTVQLSTQALDLGDEVPLVDRLQFLLARARAEIQLRELESARDDLGRAMEIAEDEGARAQVLLVRGDLEQKAGDLDASVGSLEAAIDKFRALDDDCGTADGLRSLGLTLMFQDRNVQAETAFSDALDLYKAVGDRRGEAWALQNLAWLAFSQGRADRADAWLQESAATFQDIGDAGGLGWALGLLAWVRYHQGRFDEAERLAQQMLEEARERGDRWAAGMMLVLVGALRLWTGRSSDAVAPSREAREIFAAMDDWYGHGNALGILARALVATGEIEEAFTVLDELSVIAAPAGREDMWGRLIGAVTAAQLGLPERAPHDALAMAEQTHEPGQIGFTDAVVAFGLFHLQRGDAAEAVAVLDRAVEAAPTLNSNATSALALALAAAGNTDAAIANADLVMSAESGTYADRLVALEAKGLSLAQRGDAAASADVFAQARDIVGATEDVVARALLRLAEASALEAVGDERAAMVGDDADTELDQLGLGDTSWRTAFTAAATGVDLVPR